MIYKIWLKRYWLRSIILIIALGAIVFCGSIYLKERNELNGQINLFKKYLNAVEDAKKNCDGYHFRRIYSEEEVQGFSRGCAESIEVSEAVRRTVALPKLIKAKEELLVVADSILEFSVVVIINENDYVDKADSITNKIWESISRTREELLKVRPFSLWPLF